jgi:ketosteroid isomerase-like protein
MAPDTPQQAALRVVAFFETIGPDDVARIRDLYSADAFFKDPFNEVRGVNAITPIFSHMFDALIQPRFVITQKVQQGEHCFVTWDFLFAMRKFEPNTTQTIRGASHLVFRLEEGVWRVAIHRDYWDAAEEL